MKIDDIYIADAFDNAGDIEIMIGEEWESRCNFAFINKAKVKQIIEHLTKVIANDES